MKILIVEDEEPLLKLLEEEFKNIGWTVKLAKDGTDGLTLMKTFHPDIVALDLLLPKKSGLEVLTEMKEDSAIKDIPVVVLSNLAEDENITKAIALGAKEYYVKSQHSVYEVIEKIQKHLKK
jgi:DNA-binding response OmpR family regulator